MWMSEPMGNLAKIHLKLLREKREEKVKILGRRRNVRTTSKRLTTSRGGSAVKIMDYKASMAKSWVTRY
jgi:hypothetical protein